MIYLNGSRIRAVTFPRNGMAESRFAQPQRRKTMYSLLLWFLKVSCSLSRVDSGSLHKTRKAHKVITPEGFGH